jgi:hypothetical protein
LILAALLAVSRWAKAQAPEAARSVAAQTLFEEGRALMEKSSYAAACAKFEESQRLEAANGTLINLATCYEAVGRRASAWLAFKLAAARDAAAGRARAAELTKHAATLETSLYRVAVDPPRDVDAPDLIILRDGAPLARPEWGLLIPLDPGPHTFRATAGGGREWSSDIVVPDTGGVAHLTVAFPPRPMQRETGTHPAEARSSLRIPLAVGLGATGAIGLGIGVAFAVSAASKWRTAKSECSDFAERICSDPAAVSAGDDAMHAAVGSTVAFIAGAAALGGGAALLLLGVGDHHDSEAPATASIGIVPGPGGAALSWQTWW